MYPISVMFAAASMPAGDGKRRNEWCLHCEFVAGEVAVGMAQLTNSEPPPRHAATSAKGA